MSTRRLLLPLMAVLLIGCTATPSPSPSVVLRPVTLLLGFQPDVQFAPFYLAQQKGYYAAIGLDVTIEYKSSADLVRLVADGQAEFGVADATDVMISRTAGIPIKYVETMYGLFPVALIGQKGTVPREASELAGARIGTPGTFGSSWHALLALLHAGGLTEDDVMIREYPQFNQVDGLLNGDVDLITGFRNNEPLRLAAQGMEVDLLTVEQIAPLPGPGLIVGDALLDSNRTDVAEFAAATLRAEAEIAADPQVGLDAAVVAVPAIAEDRETALAVLQATIELWKAGASAPSGLINDAVWTSGYQTMRDLGFIDGSVPLEEMADHLVNPGVS
ncbi:MAG: ABC transporter substrate-binding protein [Chloroflexi bacterium]|nr:ABC transporter substrate-binding protein [Chloroflexota bacterium]